MAQEGIQGAGAGAAGVAPPNQNNFYADPLGYCGNLASGIASSAWAGFKTHGRTFVNKSAAAAVQANNVTVDIGKHIYAAGKEKAAEFAWDSLKFVTGISNVEESINKLTESVTADYMNLPNGNCKRVTRPVGAVERVRNATAELIIAPAKLIALTTVGYGGLCKAGAALGIIEPRSIFSVGGVAETSFNGVVALGRGIIGVGLAVAPTNLIGATAVGGLTISAAKNFNSAVQLQGTERLTHAVVGAGKVGLAILGTSYLAGQ